MISREAIVIAGRKLEKFNKTSGQVCYHGREWVAIKSQQYKSGLSIQISGWGGDWSPHRGGLKGGGAKVQWGGMARDSRHFLALR